MSHFLIRSTIIKKDLELSKQDVVLKTLHPNLIDSLALLAADKRIWKHAHLALEEPATFKEKWFNKALNQMEQGCRWPFVITCKDELAGSSSYYNFDIENKSLNIGYTWYHPKFWGGGLNQAVKFLLLSYAFETILFEWVSFFVDQENQRSCAAMRKLGIKQKRILKNHFIRSDGTVRDSVVFELTRDHWADIKEHLESFITVRK